MLKSYAIYNTVTGFVMQAWQYVAESSELETKINSLATGDLAVWADEPGNPPDPASEVIVSGVRRKATVAELAQMPSGLQKAKQDVATQQLAEIAQMSYPQVEAWVDNNANNLEGVKAVLKKLAKVNLAIIKKLDWDAK